MELKNQTVPAEELEQTLQGEQPNDAEATPVKKTRSRKTQTKKTQSDTKAKNTKNAKEETGTVAPKAKLLSKSAPTDEPVVTIGNRREAETESDKAKNDLLDLLESYKAGRVLTDTIEGVERIKGTVAAVLYHGTFKVIIPAEEAIYPPNDYREKDPNAVHRYMLTKRLGAEVDYIVKGMDSETGLAVASRLDAMKARQKEFYFSRDRDGNNILYEGILAEARVTSVIKSGIFVELFGAECFISMRELSYQRWADAGQHYCPGQKVIVRIMAIDRSDRDKVKVVASVKRAQENPYEKALKKYVEGNHYVGTVSMVDENGVFVAMDGGVDCLCEYPRRGRPPIGSKVTVRIIGINRETNRIWGAITHTTTVF